MPQTQTKAKTQVQLKYPNRYRVIIFNDDTTPMEFVIQILIEIFNKDIESATELTMEVHTKGKATAGIYTAEIAHEKVAESLNCVLLHGYQLKLSAEPI
jgi:ATP-dependent Clp protease adaptor protein ClpS